jgi:hypothetical protein
MAIVLAFIALFAAHQVGDHWYGQTHYEALNKGGTGEASREGRLCAFRHALKLYMHKAVFLAIVAQAADIHFPIWQFVLAMFIDVTSHYLIDRRWTLQWIAEHTGKGEFYHLGEDTVKADGTRAYHIGTGAYAMDQAAHMLFIFICALILGA